MRTNRHKFSLAQIAPFESVDTILHYASGISPEYADTTEETDATIQKRACYWRGKYKLVPAHAPGKRETLSGQDWRGHFPLQEGIWAASVKNLPSDLALPHDCHEYNAHERLDWMEANELLCMTGFPQIKHYASYAKGTQIDDNWIDIPFVAGKEDTGYPTQKPIALLERIIKASSSRRDVVFDPFCVCATALVIADKLQRQWVGIDVSPKAVELLTDRIREDQGLFKEIISSTDKPLRTDMGPELSPIEKKAHKGALFALQDQMCNGCGTQFNRLEDFEMDHITPKKYGGTDHKDNFQLLCGNCNRKKGAKSQEEFVAIMQKTISNHILTKDSVH